MIMVFVPNFASSTALIILPTALSRLFIICAYISGDPFFVQLSNPTGYGLAPGPCHGQCGALNITERKNGFECFLVMISIASFAHRSVAYPSCVIAFSFSYRSLL